MSTPTYYNIEIPGANASLFITNDQYLDVVITISDYTESDFYIVGIFDKEDLSLLSRFELPLHALSNYHNEYDATGPVDAFLLARDYAIGADPRLAKLVIDIL